MTDKTLDQSVAMKLRRRMENAVRNEDLQEQRVILKEYDVARHLPTSSPFE